MFLLSHFIELEDRDDLFFEERDVGMSDEEEDLHNLDEAKSRTQLFLDRMKHWASSANKKQWFLRVLALTAVVLFLWYFIDLVTPYQPSLSGVAWESKPAAEKMDELWNKLLYPSRGTSYGWYSLLSMVELFTENVHLTFSTISDQIPTRSVLGTKHHRKKLIHSVGVVAPAKFVKVEGSNNYSGVFEGADNAIIRMSHAVKPDFSVPNVVPGMAIKFLRDNRPSANVFAMYSLLGQTSYHYFEHDFSSHAPYFNVSLVDAGSRALFNAFLKVSQYPTFVGVSGLAEYDQQGQQVAAPRFPFRLQFQPAKSRRDQDTSDPPQKSDSYVVSELRGLPAGPLYEVYAQDSPSSDSLVHIGTLITTAETISAEYSDRDLFFQHQSFEQDLQYHPEWEDPTQDILHNQEKVLPPQGFVFPDLPYRENSTIQTL